MFNTFDIETTGTNQFVDKIFSHCIGTCTGKVAVYRGYDIQKKKMQPFFDNTNIEKIAHNFKFELSFLKQSNITVPKETIWHDTMIMSQLLHNLRPSYKLEDLWYELDDDADLSIDKKVRQQADARGGRYDRVDKDLFHEYQVMDGWRPMLLFDLYYPTIKADEDLYKEYRNEIEFTKVCIKMEEEGICVDVEETEKLINDLQIKINEIHEQVFDIEGGYINIKSDNKVRRLLYKKYKLPVLALTKTGLPSVDKDTIIELLSKFPENKEILNLVLQIRSYTTGCSIATSYLDLMDSNNIVHPSIQPNEARTGRPSCRKPNLLNVAKEDVRKNPYPVPARKCFRVKPDQVLYFPDYKGLQMRLIADLCGEREMLDIIKDGGDVHRIPTELFYSGLTSPKVKKDLLSDKDWGKYRGAGKNCNFAMPFGAGVKQAATTLMLPLDIARIGVEAYCYRFPRVAAFSASQMNQVRRFGYVMTHFGRKLYVLKDKAYMGANYLIQGDEAGLMKRAIVKINNYFEERWDDQLRLILDIYDEIIFSAPCHLVKYEKEYMEDVSILMTDIPQIKVRLDVEWKRSKGTWHEAVKFPWDIKRKIKARRKAKKRNA